MSTCEAPTFYIIKTEEKKKNKEEKKTCRKNQENKMTLNRFISRENLFGGKEKKSITWRMRLIYSNRIDFTWSLWIRKCLYDDTFGCFVLKLNREWSQIETVQRINSTMDFLLSESTTTQLYISAPISAFIVYDKRNHRCFRFAFNFNESIKWFKCFFFLLWMLTTTVITWILFLYKRL